jgi:hypothetical protein
MTRCYSLSLKIRCLVISACLLVACHSLLITAFAQSASATLSGTVADEHGAVIPGVTITVTNNATGAQRQTTTNGEGYFVVPLLPPSRYQITAQNQGFTTVRIPEVVLNVGDRKALLVRLRAGEVSAVVQVTDEAPLINESPSVSSTVNRQFVENLPLNGRSFQSLIALSPGVVLTKATSFTQGQFSVNGQRADANYFTVDGVSANVGISSSNSGPGASGAGVLPGLTASGGTSGLVSVDALQEFKIQTSSYAAEFGRTPGGQVQIATRSGTNEFSGTIFEYFRNDALDANDWFANASRLRKPALRQNDFGGVFGGPILKKRAFFFFSYEGLRLRLPQTRIATVPSLGARLSAPAGIRPFLNAFPVPNGRDFGNNTAEFISGYSEPSTLNATSIRIDHLLSNNLTLFGRYNYSPSESLARGTPTNSRTTTSSNIRTFTFGSTWAINPNLSNEFRANWSRSEGKSTATLDDLGGAVRPSDSVLFPFSSPEASLISFQIAGLGAISVGPAGNNSQEQINLVDSLTVISGNHQLKLGVDYRHLLPIRGSRDSNIVASFSNMTAVLNGTATIITVGAVETTTLSINNLSVFAQDGWRAGKRLTLTYGLRWEVNPPPKGKNGKDLFTATGLENPANLALAPRGTPLYKTTYGNFAPRFGLSYLLSDKTGRETVLRGGLGVFYDLGYGSAASSGSTFPYNRTKRFTNYRFPLTLADATPLPFDLNAPLISSVVALDPNLTLPRTYQWNIALEQSIGAKQTISASYVGAQGRELLQQRTLIAPNPRFTAAVAITNNGSSDYHALQLQFNRRLSRAVQALASYSWSQSLDTFSLSHDADTGSSTRGPSDFDVRHAFNAAITYNLPNTRTGVIGDAILRNWALDTIVYARSATPVDLIATTAVISSTSLNIRPDLVPGQPLYIDDPLAPGGRRINRAAFAIPPAGRQGTLGRNALRGLSIWQVDMALRRKVSLTERISLQLRAELFNIFNHPNFGDPAPFQGNFLSSAFFGRSTSMLGRSLGAGGASGGLNPLYQVGGPRSIQLALKLSF